jgi:hypothetical protein
MTKKINYKFDWCNFVIKEDEKPNIQKKGRFIDIEIMNPSIWITLDTKNNSYKYCELLG